MSVTIIKHVFLRRLFCYESLVDVELSDTSYSLGISDVITNVNTLTPINRFFFHEKNNKNGVYMVV